MNGQMDDHRIEDYLRSFRPLSPAPFPQRKRQWRLVALAAAAVLVIGVLLLPRFRGVPLESATPHPITIGSANNLLANSSSWKEVIDDAGFAFRRSPADVAPVPGSALEFLSQEDLSK